MVYATDLKSVDESCVGSSPSTPTKEDLQLENFGLKVKKARQYIGLTQEELGQLVECHNSHICKIETNKYNIYDQGGIGIRLALRICNELGILIEEAFKEE